MSRGYAGHSAEKYRCLDCGNRFVNSATLVRCDDCWSDDVEVL